jgi:hypothetical protein
MIFIKTSNLKVLLFLIQDNSMIALNTCYIFYKLNELKFMRCKKWRESGEKKRKRNGKRKRKNGEKTHQSHIPYDLVKSRILTGDSQCMVAGERSKIK